MPFTPDERVGEPDPVLRVKGHVTSSITLADDAEYKLGTSKTSGFDGSKSRSNLKGRYRVEVEGADDDMDLKASFSVRQRTTVVPTAWSVTTNVATITLPAGHSIEQDEWIEVGGFATAPAAVGNATTKAVVQVTGVTATTATYAATTGDDSATENGTVDTWRVRVNPGENQIVADLDAADDVDVLVGTLREGRYIVYDVGAGVFRAEYDCDGSTLLLRSTLVGTDEPEVSYADADTAAKTSLYVSSGTIRLNNNDNRTGRILVEYDSSALFSDKDLDGKICLFEKEGDLILKNRTGASETFSIERLSESQSSV